MTSGQPLICVPSRSIRCYDVAPTQLRAHDVTNLTSLLTGFSLPSVFSQSAERPHEQRRMASRKEQLFALLLVA